ncbi:MAG TPA: xanthine dehydrogenase family protein subunit M [Burkholderiales bacterium]|nr:xanthine dehydrogenase family protein subunit M [Burkholderiales bacterium]
MKAPSFAYSKPATLAEVFDLLAHHGDGAKLLAGGQSLIPSLNMRLSSPSVLVDITGLPGLSGIVVDGDTVRIGALTTHAEIERSPEIARHLPLLAQAVKQIAHVAIRNVGTFGGSVAFADPAAEYPAVCVALDATFVLASQKGERRVPARQFFKGIYETELSRGEVLVAGEFKGIGVGYRSAFLELARRVGDYAIVGVAAHAQIAGGKLADVRLAFLGAGDRPILAGNAAAAVEGKVYGPAVVKAAQDALAKDLAPPADLYHSSATKLHLARVLTGRALAALGG